MGSLGRGQGIREGFKVEKILRLKFAELVRVRKSRWRGWASKKWGNRAEGDGV